MPRGNHHQLTIFECIEIAATGSDGKPAVDQSGAIRKENAVNVSEESARHIAEVLADDAVEKAEHDLRTMLSDEQWRVACNNLEAEFAPAIQRVFAEL